MKKIKLLIAITLLCGVFAACKKDMLLTYNTASNSIYFNYFPAQLPLDTTVITFAYTPALITDSVYKIPLLVTGVASPTDRTYNVVVDTGTTAVAGKHYTLPATFIFHANRLNDSLPVKLLRTADLQTKAITLRVTLKPSADLNTDVRSVQNRISGADIKVTSFKLNISDIITAGPYWNSNFLPYVGAFSVKKVQLMNQVTGMPLNYITTIAVFYDPDYQGRLSYYCVTMANYLSAQKAAGHTVYEADGVTPMLMGYNFQ